MDEGTPIFAPGDGIIRNSGWLSDNYLANDWWLTAMGGDTLVIDCFGPDGTTATGPTFIIAHLKDSTAPVGARVKKGQQIGISGNSGTATTGAHAHIEALPPSWDWNNGVYGRVNPESYFTEWPEDIIQTQSTPIQKEWFEMPIAQKELLQIAAAVNNKDFRNDIATETAAKVLAAPILSTDGKRWPLSAHVQGNTARIVQIAAEQAAQRELIEQLAAGTGTAIDYDKVREASKAGAASALAEGVDLDATVTVKKAA
jgi:hypothetical protein